MQKLHFIENRRVGSFQAMFEAQQQQRPNSDYIYLVHVSLPQLNVSSPCVCQLFTVLYSCLMHMSLTFLSAKEAFEFCGKMHTRETVPGKFSSSLQKVHLGYY